MNETPEPEPDDGLAAALGKFVREREAEDYAARPGEWEAVLGGELELDVALARRRSAGVDDDTLAQAAAYFAPLDAGETSALVDGLLAGLDEQKKTPDDPGAKVIPLRPKGSVSESESSESESSESESSESESSESESSSSPKPAHDPGKSRSWWIPGGMLVAAAAAIALWWVWPRDGELLGGDTGTTIAQRDPLPSFELETDGGLRELRGGDTGAASQQLRYRRDTPFSWVLRPAESTAAAVDLRGFAQVDGGAGGLPLALAELTQVAESGAIRIAGEIRQLGLEPGRYMIVLVVGTPGQLPSDAAALAEAGSDVAWQVQRIEIEIAD